MKISAGILEKKKIPGISKFLEISQFNKKNFDKRGK